jgi:L-ascorbate metabolism protein UlaG (beta-lactamase superfamily)
MDITWLGYAATRIRTRAAAVVADPYRKSAVGTMGRPDAHIITISHHDEFRDGVDDVAPADGDPIILEGPGEYEIRGVIVEGVRSTLRAPGTGQKRLDSADLRSTLWLIEAEDLRVAHLGGLGAPLTTAQLDVLGVADIAIVPIDMPDVLGAADAAKAVRALEPSIVIPIGYDAADETALKAFIAGLGVTPEAPVARFSVSRRGADEEMRVVLLEARA